MTGNENAKLSTQRLSFGLVHLHNFEALIFALANHDGCEDI